MTPHARINAASTNRYNSFCFMFFSSQIGKALPFQKQSAMTELSATAQLLVSSEIDEVTVHTGQGNIHWS
jgi:hypothetical protein